MRPRKNSRALHVAFVLALIAPSPLVAHAQDAMLDGSDAGAPPALTPPSLRADSAPVLPPLPPGSSPESVVLELTVDQEGLARDAVVLRSAGEVLDRAALDAVALLRFSPALRAGAPIVARIPFRFEFQPAPAAPPPTPPPVEPSADEPETLSDALTLDVQGDKPPRETTVHKLDISESQKLPGTNGDPLRAIEALPGVARPPASEAMLIVRGSAPGDSAVFIDGIQVPLAYHFSNLSSVVPNDSLAQLELRPGNFAAEYGRAMGGIVELGLRAPRRDRVGGVLQLDAIDGRLMIEGPLGARTRFLIAARRSWLDAWIGKLDEDIKSAPVYYDAQAVLEHDLTRRTTARLFFFGADDRMKLLFDAPASDDPAIGGKLSLGTRFARLALRFDSRLHERLTLRQTYSWGIDDMQFDLGSESQDIHAHRMDARLELRARLDHWITGVVGIDTQLAKYDVALHARPYPATDEVEEPRFARPTRTLEGAPWLYRPAVYAQLELTPVDGLRVIPGVRADYVHDARQLTVDPRISVRADVHPRFPRTTLKGGIGFYSQPPMGVESVLPFGSPGVKSNRALHVSVGVEQELARGLDLSLEGFTKQLSKLVVGVVDESQNNVGARFANTGAGRVYGGELLLRYRDPKGRAFGWLAYTLSRSERRNDASEPYHPFEFDQTHILSALGNVQLGWGMSAGARFRYVTGSPDTPLLGGIVDLDAGVYAPVPGTPYAGRLPAYHQLDLRLDKTWQLGPTKLVAYVEVRNTYNRKNSDDRSYRFDYSQSKPGGGLPILPVIGLRGEL